MMIQRFYKSPDEPEGLAPFILLAEDDLALQALMELRLKAEGYRVKTVANGDLAWDYINSHTATIDAIILDHYMPGVEGLDLVKRMQGLPALQHLPVVMHTSADKPEQIAAGIEAGVYYYLTKPCPEQVLHAVIAAAVRETRQMRVLAVDLKRQQGAFHVIDEANLKLRTLEEAENVACWLAHAFPDPQRAVQGLAALLINAVEHGNAGLGFDAKGPLLASGKWREEVASRLNLKENRDKQVEVSLQRDAKGVTVRIVDDGPGFEWPAYLQVSPQRAQNSHGRGIARARTLSFDKLEYNAKGNEVTVWTAR